MEVKFDFTLNSRRFGVVEQAIFKLVLRGVSSAQGISESLWIFSDDVKATAIEKIIFVRWNCCNYWRLPRLYLYS